MGFGWLVGWLGGLVFHAVKRSIVVRRPEGRGGRREGGGGVKSGWGCGWVGGHTLFFCTPLLVYLCTPVFVFLRTPLLVFCTKYDTYCNAALCCVTLYRTVMAAPHCTVQYSVL